MATISLEVEKLLAAFVLALCDLGTCTASRAPIKFCIWPVIFAMLQYSIIGTPFAERLHSVIYFFGFYQKKQEFYILRVKRLIFQFCLCSQGCPSNTSLNVLCLVHFYVTVLIMFHFLLNFLR